MIKDCIEDTMLLSHTRKPLRDQPKQSSDPRMQNLGCGVPTVEEVEEVNVLYYGPPKVSRPLHGSL